MSFWGKRLSCDRGLRGTARWPHFLLAAGLALSASADAATAPARGFGGLAALEGIGFGVGFLEALGERGTCRDAQERFADASGNYGLSLLGSVSGIVVGGMLGERLFNSTELGAVGGAIVGGYLGSRWGEDLGSRAAAGARNDSDEFAFQTCSLIAASAVVRRPLLNRYLEIAQARCGFEPELGPRMEDRDWNTLVDCTSSESEEARQIVLQLIRINQATCFAIDMVGRSIDSRPADSGAPTVDESVDPECDARSPSELWQSYLRDRM